ncbi:bifunctional metallophosphatase/5'-nucleotidase [Rubinisphaera margarita]|uniref:bifunctional metallophosphatase/5'-nucleotidase n=1 Tax=Rubinisphaera margarita TaxID=2909586 RepID=UPI001EE97D34|nr:bifunctional UDP-sugar hydrolase/5'-nucleotidase [Rubinisphaera margarita]MCG6155879.1 bifunctional metallophosphatase/5'-nucleotidase [Rubinisphaera margarita]
MNRGSMILFALILGGGCSVALGGEDTESPSAVITILHTCDFHGRHMPFVVGPGNATSQTGNPRQPDNHFEREGSIGGFEALAAAVKEIRRERGEQNVLLLHAGDTFSDDLLGNLTQGEAIIRLMNAVEFDYMALGNHDFDYGLSRTRRLQELAKFPMRGANVIERETGKPLFGEPFKVFSAGKAKVAVLALGYHNTDQTTAPKNIRGLEFTDGSEVAAHYVPELRRQADVVVVLSHQGTAVDSLLAQRVEGIDLIIGGHSHDRIHPALEVSGTKIVQAMSDTAALGEVRIRIANGRIESIEDELHMLWSEDFPPDQATATLIDSLRKPHRDQLEQSIGTAAAPIARQYKQESQFDGLVAELLRQQSGADVAFLPGVGYGITLRKGKVSREALYTLLPHPAKLVTLRLTGKQIRDTLEQSATNLTATDPRNRVGGLIQTAGMTWTVVLDSPGRQRIRDVKVDGVSLDDARVYNVATHSGMLQGIHQYAELTRGKDVQITNKRVVDIVEDHFRNAPAVSPPTEQHVTVINSED